jgi:hypothetical protein
MFPALPDSAAISPDDDVLPPFLLRKPRARPIHRPHWKFTPQKDLRLLRLVEEHGPNSWRLIAKHMDNRNSRQCRERWLNYLNPALNTQPWTAAEDALLEQKYAQMGPRWVFMMRFFPNRTNGMIKNRFQVLQRTSQTIFAAGCDDGEMLDIGSPAENGPASQFEFDARIYSMLDDRERPAVVPRVSRSVMAWNSGSWVRVRISRALNFIRSSLLDNSIGEGDGRGLDI